SNHPEFLADPPTRDFVCDSLRILVVGVTTPSDLDQLMDLDIEVQRRGRLEPVAALHAVAEALPGLGIVAAVLGVVITMQSIGGAPGEVGGDGGPLAPRPAHCHRGICARRIAHPGGGVRAPLRAGGTTPVVRRYGDQHQAGRQNPTGNEAQSPGGGRCPNSTCLKTPLPGWKCVFATPPTGTPPGRGRWHTRIS